MKFKKIETGTKQWFDSLSDIIISRAPVIVECDDCGIPTIIDYCCWRCKSESPGKNEIDVEEWLETKLKD